MNINCDGSGYCIQQCSCQCDEDEIDADDFVCNCEHSQHTGGYCPNRCNKNCQLKKCRLCEHESPEWVLICRYGLCGNCYVAYGNIQFLDKKEECPICLETKEMVEIMCEKHLFCLECWMSHCNQATAAECPICRKSIWKQQWIYNLKKEGLN